MICFHPCKGTNLIFSAPKTDRHWVWFVFGGINEKCSQQSTNHAVGGEPYNQGRLAVRPAPPLCTLLTQSRGGAVGNRWARASVWSERMRDEDVSLLWWWLQASGSIWRPADWSVISEEHEVPLRWAICFIKRPFSQSIQLSSGEPSAVLPALYRLSHWVDATCGTG